MSSSIVAEPLNPHDGFNWVFLVELLISGILTVFFLFYFNRLFATLVSYGIRAYTWHQFDAYIDIQALQISLLGGRIFFKDIRYHAHNETILVHGGHITWQYWLRRVKDADVYSNEPPGGRRSSSGPPSSPNGHSDEQGKSEDHAEKGGKAPQKQLPCRITVKFSGLEAFMYNRSPAYDGIIDAVQRKANEASERDQGAANAPTVPATSAPPTASATHSAKDGHDGHKLRGPKFSGRKSTDRVDSDHSAGSSAVKAPLPAFLQLLPIYLECNKGAIVIGNENTPSVITAHFEKASGEIDAAKSGPLDVYQQAFNFKFTRPVVHMRNNPDYKTSQLEAAAQIKQNAADGATGDDLLEVPPEEPAKRRRGWQRKLPGISALFGKSSDSIHTHPLPHEARRSHAPQLHVPGENRWKGLTRYVHDSLNTGHDEWSTVEYAKTTLILDSPRVNVRFYWDITGSVPSELENSLYVDPVYAQDINGSNPPDYGVDIQIHGGTVNYGPWADRRRAIFQTVYFPASHVDATPASPLKPGDSRVLSIFKVFLSIEEDTVLRIPVREPSKDWKWKGKAAAMAGKAQSAEKGKGKGKARRRFKSKDNATPGISGRPFGWIDIKVSGNSTVNYKMDMVASKSGFRSKLDVDIAGAEVSSSVNHGVLCRSRAITLDCDLSTPIGWKSLRKWYFNVMCRDLELFLLRDHLFLLTDLVADWGSGPATDYYNFVPFQYFLNIDFADFKLYINTNDSNIVNNPTDLDDNNFFILGGRRLHGDVTIPLDRFRPHQNEITFDLRGQNLRLESQMPSRSTLNTFVRVKDIASLRALSLSGSHTYMADTSPMNTDRLFMDIRGSGISLDLFGWVIHHFMKIKDNYFGEDMHFKTSEEFQGLPSQTVAVDVTLPHGQAAKISNDLDVILSISADQGTVSLPSNLYSAGNCLRAEVPYLSADLRFTNYYMDLVTNFSPIRISVGTASSSPEDSQAIGGSTEVFIDSVAILGHRVFGLPPTEPTYVCNWDFQVGKVTGECTSEFIERAVGSARSFMFTFDDPENTLAASDPIVIHDSTFLRLQTQDIRVWLHIATEAILVSTGPVSLDFNDLADLAFSERLNVSVPTLTVGIVDARTAARQRSSFGNHLVRTHAFLETSLSINMLGRKFAFSENRDAQQAHLREHDRRTHRTEFMFLDKSPLSAQGLDGDENRVRPPAMQFPGLPHPVFLYRPQQATSASSNTPGSLESLSVRRIQLRSSSQSSSASLAHSINSVRKQRVSGQDAPTRGKALRDRSASQGHDAKRENLSDLERPMGEQNGRLSSVALSSSLASPHFSMNGVLPDMSEVPQLPPVSSGLEDDDKDDIVFNDVVENHRDENLGHTSFIVRSTPGIRVYCTPEAVRCISNLVALLLPHRPEDLLDGFHVDTMTRLLERQKRGQRKGDSVELCVRIPFLHFRLQNDFASHAGMKLGKDQYDIILNRLKMAVRFKTPPSGGHEGNVTATHTSLGSLGVSITERTLRGPSDDVAVQAELCELLVWTLKKDEASIHISFKSLEAATASKKLAYLGSLIHRTTLLNREIVVTFERASESHKSRLRYLAWFLSTVQQRFPDPAFLTKASYALRATKDHLRNHDSWKIVSRFRYIWQCLPEAEKQNLMRMCSQKSTSCPADAEAKTFALWDHWRTWDLAHVRKSLAMKILFGGASADGPPAPEFALHIDVRAHSLKLIVDPGPSQSETSLTIIAVNVTSTPPLQPSGLMLVPTETPKRSITVQLKSKETSLNLHWEICKLIESLVADFEKDKMDRTKSRPPLSTHSSESTREDNDFQFVYVSDYAEFTVGTINLRGNATGDLLRFSLAISDRNASELGKTTTMLCHLDKGVMELQSQSRPLLMAQYDYPSLYLAHHDHGVGVDAPVKIHVAGASRMMRLHIEENILGLIEVIDKVLRDEVAYIKKQAHKLRQTDSNDHDAPSASEATPARLPKFTLALFMDAYSIDLALLQSLSWTVEGSLARISIVPALGQNVALRIDYDVSAHFHRMVNKTAERPHTISSVEVPPHNGRWNVSHTDTETRISASSIIETIHLQASELQALAATLNKPEISHIIRAIREDVDALNSRFHKTFPHSPETAVSRPSNPPREIIFDVGVTLSGLIIHATAPGKAPNSATANLTLKLASMQLKATNVGPDMARLPLPEVIAQLGELSAEMILTDGQVVRRCGNFKIGANFYATSQKDEGGVQRVYRLRSSGLEVNVFADTASAVVDVMNHLQDKIKDLDLEKERKYLQKLRIKTNRIASTPVQGKHASEEENISPGVLFTSMYYLELLKIEANWIVGTSIASYPGTESEDLSLSIRRINFSTKKGDTARLIFEDMQLQMVPASAAKDARSRNSALLPEVVFHVGYSSTKESRNIAFQAAGKSLDLRLDSRFLLPASVVQRSISLASKKLRASSANWSVTPTASGAERKNPFRNKAFASLLVSANFAGAVVHINSSDTIDTSGKTGNRSLTKGRYSQFVGEESKSSMVMQAPGIALKVEYKDKEADPSVNAELRIDASSNTLYPTVVPLLIDISESIKEVVREEDTQSPDSVSSPEEQSKPASKIPDDDSNLLTVDPNTLLGRTQLNLGLRICKQEFSLSCQPIARVAAIAKIEDIYVTLNSVKSQEHGHFFAASAALQKFQAKVQHVYSRESTFGFEVDSILLSLMNSKHLSGTSGISAILKINPVGLQVNARQLQDFLLFREIWMPPEIRQGARSHSPDESQEPHEYLIQRYEQVTAATAFPWNASITIAEVSVDLDLGQAIGKSSLRIQNLWASSKKGTNWEQNLCIGAQKMALVSTGRTSGFVELNGVKVRTTINWPSQELGFRQTPLVQAAIGFDQLQAKTGFDYQAFLIADISDFHFLMYNVRDKLKSGSDRLVAVLDGGNVNVCCTATSASQGLALFQAIERLIQENQQAYAQSLRDIEKYLRRRSSASTPFPRSASQSTILPKPPKEAKKMPISLHTDVVVTLRSVSLGVFPSTFVDSQIFSVEAADVQTRFVVAPEEGKIHSGLGVTLGKLSVALAGIPTPKKMTPVSDLTVEDVLESAQSARGGIILRVPKVIANMHTWQAPRSDEIEYIFQSNFEGKVDVGWNYSRISYIRSMWSNHARSLASRLGKPLPESNIRITSSQHKPDGDSSSKTTTIPSAAKPPIPMPPNPFSSSSSAAETETSTASSAQDTSRDDSNLLSQDGRDERKEALSASVQQVAPAPAPPAGEKITAEIKVPQSRYKYRALEPPVIVTPQLRDMGEATPPLEWIGLHRDRLPNVTHQVFIVSLLEVAREVEDSYHKILGSG